MSRVRQGLWAVGLCAAFWMAPSIARAQERDAVAAEALFRAGRELARNGDYVAACPKFADSYELDPSLGTLLNLADCEERTGKVASAWSHFQSLAQNLPTNDERYRYAREHIALLEPRLPKISVKLSPKAPAGAKVKRDGLAVGRGSLGFPVPVDPGEHSIVVTAPGHAERRYTVTVKEAQLEELEVTAGEKLPEESPLAPPSATSTPGMRPLPPDVPADRGTDPTRTAGWVTLGMGGASLIVGAVFGGFALGKKSELADYGCASDDVCEKDKSPGARDSQQVSDDGKTFAAISTVGFAVGAVGVGLGTFLLLSSDESGAETRAGVRGDPGGARFMLQRSF